MRRPSGDMCWAGVWVLLAGREGWGGEGQGGEGRGGEGAEGREGRGGREGGRE